MTPKPRARPNRALVDKNAYAYPHTVEGEKIGFLEEFADIGELTSDPKVRTGEGRITAQPLQTVMPAFDRLSGNRFMAAGR